MDIKGSESGFYLSTLMLGLSGYGLSSSGKAV
jgi:hypothetical protein